MVVAANRKGSLENECVSIKWTTRSGNGNYVAQRLSYIFINFSHDRVYTPFFALHFGLYDNYTHSI